VLIHAFRRKAKENHKTGDTITTHELGGTHYKFRLNEAGDVVCEIADPVHIKRFLFIRDAFKPYKGEAVPEGAEADPEKDDAKVEKFVLVSGNARVDLKEMKDAELHEFAKGQELTLDKKLKGDALRQAIITGLTGA
jgi:hypothetical protein